MNKTELIKQVAEACDIDRRTVALVLEAEAQVIAGHLDALRLAGEEVALPGLGKLKTHTRAARTGRNPQTGAAVEIPARVVVKFHIGKDLDQQLNGA